jgi:hypothetical protein
VVFIFCDVTNSLNKSESEMVATMASKVLATFPTGTEYRIYPILAQTYQLAPINDNEQVLPPRDENPKIQDINQKKRQEEITSKLANLYNVTNAGRYDNRTCILNAIDFASNQLKDFGPDDYDRELIFISDMLEECDVTPLQHRINLRKGDISEEIKLASNFPKGADLSHMRITIITPTTEDTYLKYQPGLRPPMSSLQEFWYNIFKQCNIPPEAFPVSDYFYWSNGVIPNRLTKKKEEL